MQNSGYARVLKNQGFNCLLAAQALSVFNDNAFRYVLQLLVIDTVATLSGQSRLVSYCNALFVLPYVLFSSCAGQVADRFSKRRVIVSLKLLEVGLMAAATLAVHSGNIPVMLAVLFLAGTHSAFLAPAKEGILPQMLPDRDLSRANGLMQLTVYTLIIVGPVVAGLLRPSFPGQPWVPVAFLIPVALGSFAVSLGITTLPAIAPFEKFRLNAIGEFRKNLREIRASRELLLTVLGIAYFWFLGTIYLQNVLMYGRDLLHLGDRGVTLLNACVSIGIGLGAFMAGKLSGDRVELGLVPIGSIGLGVFAIDLCFAPHALFHALVGHFLLGVSGGCFIVPLEAYLQQRAGEHTKGRVTVSFGPALAPESAAFQVRQTVMKLSAEAFAQRDAHQRPLPELFLDSARRNWRRFAMADSMGRKLDFGRALTGAMIFRSKILDRCPNPETDKFVGVLLPPSVPTALLNLGSSMAGRVPVNLNYTTSTEAMNEAIERCGIKTILTSEAFLEKLSMPKRPDMVMIEDIAGSISKIEKVVFVLGARLLPRFVLRRWLLPRNVKLDSLATVIFSSGCTGAPKGVMLSHRNIVSNIEGTQQAIHVDRKDCLLDILPFFHSFGFTVGLWLPAVSGFGVVYHANPLESRKIGELCCKYHVTLMISTPTFAWDYVRRCRPEGFRSVRLAVVGAEKMKPELADAFKAKFGVEMYEGYGCTELSPVVAVGTGGYSGSDLQQLGHKPGSVGHPIPGVAVRVVKPNTSEELMPNLEGMLLVKGPNVMMGYLGDTEKTKQAITEDGWYVTGDIARVDEDGFISITDRLSRFSKIGGEMVPHFQVEDAMQQSLGSAEPKVACN